VEYALYKGEEILSIGTMKEIAKELEVQYRTIKYLTTGAYKRKLAKRKNPKNYRILVEIDESEVEQ
jgi:orotate phosphoribosyltransferase-like protein